MAPIASRSAHDALALAAARGGRRGRLGLGRSWPASRAWPGSPWRWPRPWPARRHRSLADRAGAPKAGFAAEAAERLFDAGTLAPLVWVASRAARGTPPLAAGRAGDRAPWRRTFAREAGGWGIACRCGRPTGPRRTSRSGRRPSGDLARGRRCGRCWPLDVAVGAARWHRVAVAGDAGMTAGGAGRSDARLAGPGLPRRRRGCPSAFLRRRAGRLEPYRRRPVPADPGRPGPARAHLRAGPRPAARLPAAGRGGSRGVPLLLPVLVRDVPSAGHAARGGGRARPAHRAGAHGRGRRGGQRGDHRPSSPGELGRRRAHGGGPGLSGSRRWPRSSSPRRRSACSWSIAERLGMGIVARSASRKVGEELVRLLVGERADLPGRRPRPDRARRRRGDVRGAARSCRRDRPCSRSPPARR